MTNHDYVGVDIAKIKFDACVECGDKFHHSVFKSSDSGFKEFKKWLSKYTTNPWVCLEATGKYGEPLAEFLCRTGISVSIINPMQVKNFAKSILSRNKNDVVDSKVILLYAKSAIRLKEFEASSKATKELRESVKLIELLESQRQQLRGQLESARCKAIKSELEKAIKALEKRIKNLEKRLATIVEKDDDLKNKEEKFISIKGIGKKTSYRLMAYLPNLSQYDKAKQLAAYAGLSPRQFQSGSFEGQTKLSKFGNADLRRCLYMSAVVAKNKNPHFKGFCKRLEKNGLKPKQIICAVMRKLLHIIFGMCKSGNKFDPALV